MYSQLINGCFTVRDVLVVNIINKKENKSMLLKWNLIFMFLSYFDAITSHDILKI
jgi:hypothetical protein